MHNFKAFYLFLFSFLFFPWVSSAIEYVPTLNESVCRTALKSKSVTAEICAYSTRFEIVTVTLNRDEADQSPLVIQAVFDNNFDPFRSSEQPPFWRRLWVASGSPIIRENEQALIRDAIAAAGKESIDLKALVVIDFIANFVAPNEAVPEYDAGTEEFLLKERKGKYTMICHLVGKLNFGTYVAYGKTVVTSAIVGDPETRCRGRCGIGCYQFMQWRTSQYTQECFEHDVCHAETGSMMGPCSDSFWKAYYGYMNAPNCFE